MSVTSSLDTLLWRLTLNQLKHGHISCDGVLQTL